MVTEENKTIEKREKILNVAEILFAQQGFEAVSIRELAKVADINIAMISYYFGSKEKLYEEIVLRKLTSTEKMKSIIEQHNTYTDKLFAISDLYADVFIENRNFHNIIFREMAMEQRTMMNAVITENLYKNFTLLSDIIRKGIKAGEFKKNIDIELVATTVIAVNKLFSTSPIVICKILNVDESEFTYGEKHKKRLKKYLHNLLTSYLAIP